MVNKHCIVGRVGQMPEVRYTSNGKAVANFSVATTEKWKGADGQQHEETTWHDIEAWGRLGEVCGEYLDKGSLVYVEGPNIKQKWTDQNGNERVSARIKAREMKMLSPKSQQSSGGSGGNDYPSGGAMGSGWGGFEQDVPFSPSKV